MAKNTLDDGAQLFLQEYWDCPQLAQDHVSDSSAVASRFLGTLSVLASMHEKNAKTVEKCASVSREQLAAMSTTGNTFVAAVFAFASSLKSIGEQQRSLGLVLSSQIIPSLTSTIKETQKGINHSISDHIAIQHKTSSQSLTPGSAAYMNGVAHTSRSLRNLLLLFQTMEKHREERLSDALSHFLSQKHELDTEVSEALETLGLILSSISLSEDFKSEMLSVVHSAGVFLNTEQAECLDNNNEGVSKLLENVFMKREKKEWTNRLLEGVLKISQNTTTVCEIGQQIVTGIRESSDWTSKCCKKIQGINPDTKKIQLQPEHQREHDNESVNDSKEDNLSDSSNEVKQRVEYLEDHNTPRTGKSQSKRDPLKVLWSQLGIILNAYQEAKLHLKQKVKQYSDQVPAPEDSTSPFSKLQKKLFYNMKDKSATRKASSSNVAIIQVFAQFLETHKAMTQRVHTLMHTLLDAVKNWLSSEDTYSALQFTLPQVHDVVVKDVVKCMMDQLCQVEVVQPNTNQLLPISEFSDSHQIPKPRASSESSISGPAKAVSPVNRKRAGQTVDSRAEKEARTRAEFNLPKVEQILRNFSCAYLPQNIPLHGRMVLTSRFVCFAAMVGGTRLVIPYSDITQITKAKSAWGLLSNSLVLVLGEQRLFFTSFFHRDQCYKEIISHTKKHKAKVDAHATTGDDGPEDESAHEWKVYHPRNLNTGSKGLFQNKGFLRLSKSFTELNQDDSAVSETTYPAIPDTQDVDVTSSDAHALRIHRLAKSRQAVEGQGKSVKPGSDSAVTESMQEVMDSVAEDVNSHYLPLKLEDVVNHFASDMWHKMGEEAGDYELNTTPWSLTPAEAFEGIADLLETGFVERVFSFKKPLDYGSPFSKTVANTRQRQRFYNCSMEDNNVRVLEGTDTVTYTVDTLLSGFIYSECFRTSVTWTLSRLKPKGDYSTQWTKIMVSTNVTFLKKISLSYIRSKIDSENASSITQLGKEVAARIRQTLGPEKAPTRTADALVDKADTPDVVQSIAVSLQQLVTSGFNIWILLILCLQIYIMYQLHTLSRVLVNQ